MKLSDGPSNWVGIALLLILAAVFAVAIHWIGSVK
jgi:hypothetical protein